MAKIFREALRKELEQKGGEVVHEQIRQRLVAAGANLERYK